VEVHIQGQWQAVGFEDAGQESVVTGGIVQNIEQRLFVGLAGPPGVGAGIVLPEGAQIAGLPAFDRLGRGFVAGVRGEVVFDGPAAKAGAVGFKIQTAVEFAGTSAVGRGRLGSQKFVNQGQDLRRPSGMMIAAGKAGRPNLGLTFGASAEVLAVKFVEARPGQAQFTGRFMSGKRGVSMAGQEVTDDGGRQAFDQL